MQRRRGRGELRWRSGRRYKSRRRIQGSRGAAARGRWQVRGIVAEGMPSTRLVPAAGGERGGGALAPAWRPPPHQGRRGGSSSLDMPPTCRSFIEVVGIVLVSYCLLKIFFLCNSPHAKSPDPTLLVLTSCTRVLQPVFSSWVVQSLVMVKYLKCD